MKAKRIITLFAVAGLVVPALSAHAQFEGFLGQDKKPTTKKIAVFAVNGPLTETPVEMPPLFASEPPMSLKGLLERLKEARLDSSVSAVVMEVQNAQLGTGQLEEIHASLRKFAAVDKPVYIHADSLTTSTYALATSASHISIVPTGDVWLVGMHGEAPYMRGGLDKLGMYPDFLQCGDFKTAAEALTRTEPSEESHEMTDWLLDSIFNTVVGMIAEARGMTPDKVREIIDGGPYSAEEALALGLIDSVQHRQAFAKDIEKRYGKDTKVVRDYGKKGMDDIPEDFFGAFAFFMELLNPQPREYHDPSIAVVYVEGPIQTGKAEMSPFGGSSGAFSTTIRKALDRAAEEDSVKAVVLRVDSPGGSALASEIILHATKRVAEKKPLIVSMGNVAGSGGYYVTCASNTIFADKATITASIGVVGGKIVTTGFWDKLGINWDARKRGENAAIFSTGSKFSDRERAKVRHYMDTVYDIFKNHVTKARGEKLAKPIDELAGGRVFTGEQALALGLVDKIGGLEDAIKYAAQEAHLGEYEIRVIPEPPTIFDMFGGQQKDEEYIVTAMPNRGAFELTDAPLFRELLPILAQTDPLRCAAIQNQLTKIELIAKENIAVVMPHEWLFR